MKTLSPEKRKVLRDQLFAYTEVEAADRKIWKLRCQDPDCPLAGIVWTDTDQRRHLIAELPDEDVLHLLAKHMRCYEDRVLHQIDESGSPHVALN